MVDAELDAMIGGGLITLERANVIMYRAETAPGHREPAAPDAQSHGHAASEG